MRHWQKLQAGTLYFFQGGFAKFTLRPSLAFSYIGSVTAWHLLNSVQQTEPPIFGGRPSGSASALILVVVVIVVIVVVPHISGTKPL